MHESCNFCRSPERPCYTLKEFSDRSGIPCPSPFPLAGMAVILMLVMQHLKTPPKALSALAGCKDYQGDLSQETSACSQQACLKCSQQTKAPIIRRRFFRVYQALPSSFGNGCAPAQCHCSPDAAHRHIRNTNPLFARNHESLLQEALLSASSTASSR